LKKKNLLEYIMSTLDRMLDYHMNWMFFHQNCMNQLCRANLMAPTPQRHYLIQHHHAMSEWNSKMARDIMDQIGMNLACLGDTLHVQEQLQALPAELTVQPPPELPAGVVSMLSQEWADEDGSNALDEAVDMVFGLPQVA
jgi:hypothetical protein